MEHRLTGVVRRTVEEKFDVTVEAATTEEAADIVYAVLSDYPDSELSAARLLLTSRESVGEAEVLELSISTEISNDEEDYYE